MRAICKVAYARDLVFSLRVSSKVGSISYRAHVPVKSSTRVILPALSVRQWRHIFPRAFLRRPQSRICSGRRSNSAWTKWPTYELHLRYCVMRVASNSPPKGILRPSILNSHVIHSVPWNTIFQTPQLCKLSKLGNSFPSITVGFETVRSKYEER